MERIIRIIIKKNKACKCCYFTDLQVLYRPKDRYKELVDYGYTPEEVKFAALVTLIQLEVKNPEMVLNQILD